MQDFELVFPDDVKKYMELQCNGKIERYTNLPELKYIQNELNIIPKNVLEIGCGVGRGAVAFFKYFNWTESNFYMLDGNSGDVQYNGVRPRPDSDKEFYNSFDATRSFCSANGISSENLYILDAETDDWLKTNVQYDFVFSLLAIGFHWPIQLYLNKIYSNLANECLLIFGIRGTEKMDFVIEQVKNIDPNKYQIEKLIVEKTHERSSILVLKKIVTNESGAIEMWKKYKKRGEDHQSGKGSTLKATEHIREKLPEIFSKYNIKSMNDAPCGSFHWMNEVDLTNINYIGFDINKEIIKNNKNQYLDFTFVIYDIVKDILPKADLILCRDCLFHLSFKYGLSIIEKFKASGAKYLLATTHPNMTENEDLNEQYGFRKINLQLEPYFLGEILEFINEPEFDRGIGLWEL